MNEQTDNELRIFSFGDELEFKKAFVIKFLASCASVNYHQAVYSNETTFKLQPPLELAENIANDVWKIWCEKMPMRRVQS